MDTLILAPWMLLGTPAQLYGWPELLLWGDDFIGSIRDIHDFIGSIRDIDVSCAFLWTIAKWLWWRTTSISPFPCFEGKWFWVGNFLWLAAFCHCFHLYCKWKYKQKEEEVAFGDVDRGSENF